MTRLSVALLPGLVVLALALIGALSLPSAATAARAEPYVAFEGAPAAGPARFDRTHAIVFGPRLATQVLILIPGYPAGAGEFTLVARELVKRVPGLQVWAWERRSEAFEDDSVFRQRDPRRASPYYLQSRRVGGRRFRPVRGADAPFARRWGLELALEDLRNVVTAARAGGTRRVVLGGRQLGAEIALAYASWDFDGARGYRDLSGLALINGALLGASPPSSPGTLRGRLRALRAGDPFADILGSGEPWRAGVTLQTAALYALAHPNSPSPLQRAGLLAPALAAPVAVTNEAALGHALDVDSAAAQLEPLRFAGGALSGSGDPRRWIDSAVTPVERVARLLAGNPVNALEWYFPERLRIDLDGADRLERSATTRLLGLRLFHRRRVNVPLYAFQGELAGGSVLVGARRFFRGSRVPRATFASDPRAGTLDALTASPRRNGFLETVEPFLERLR